MVLCVRCEGMAGGERSCVTVIEVLGGIAVDRGCEGFDSPGRVYGFSVISVCVV